MYLPLIRKLINPLLNPTLAFSDYKNLIKEETKISENNQQTVDNTSSIFGKYDQEKIQLLLTMMENGKQLDDSHSLGFEYADALKFYNRAVELSKLDKLIYGRKKIKSAHMLIAPTLPKTEKEKALVRIAFRNIESLYEGKQGKNNVDTMLEVFLQKVNKSHADLRFTFKEQGKFYEFLDIVLQIIPAKHWQVNICYFQRKSNTQAKRGDKKHVAIINKDKQNLAVKKFKKDYPKLAKKFTSNQFYSGYSLRLLSPVKVGDEYYASNVLRYVCHLLLVVVDGV